MKVYFKGWSFHIYKWPHICIHFNKQEYKLFTAGKQQRQNYSHITWRWVCWLTMCWNLAPKFVYV